MHTGLLPICKVKHILFRHRLLLETSCKVHINIMKKIILSHPSTISNLQLDKNSETNNDKACKKHRLASLGLSKMQTPAKPKNDHSMPMV